MSNPYDWVEVAPGVTMPPELAPQGLQYQPHPGAEMPAVPVEAALPVGAQPGLGVPELAPPAAPWEQAAPVQAQPEPFLPPGVDRRSVSGSVSYQGPGIIGPRNKLNIRSIEGINDAVGQNIAGGYQQATDAAAAGAQVQMDKAEALQPMYDERAAMYDQFAKDEADRQARVNQTLMAEEARINQAIMEVPQKDPGHYWNELTGFERTMGVMTMVLGGIQSAMNGGTNPGVQLALQLIDRDMAAQDANIETAKAKVGYAQEAYSRAGSRAYYDKLAMQEQRAMKIETLAAALEAKAHSFDSKFTQAEYLKTVAQLRMERDNTLADLANQRVQQVMTAFQANDASARGWAQIAQQRAELKFREDQARAAAKAEADKVSNMTKIAKSTGFRLGDNPDFLAPGERPEDRAKALDEAQRRGHGAKSAYEAAERLKQMAMTGKIWDPDYRAEVKQYSETIKLAMSEESGQSIARSSDKDLELFASVATGGGDLSMIRHVFGDKNKLESRIALFQDNIEKTQNDWIKSHGNTGGVNYADAIWERPVVELNQAGPDERPLSEMTVEDSNTTEGGIARIGQLGYDPSVDPRAASFKKAVEAEVKGALARAKMVRNGTGGLLDTSYALVKKAEQIRATDPVLSDYMISQALRLRDQFDKAEKNFAKKQASEAKKGQEVLDKLLEEPSGP